MKRSISPILMLIASCTHQQPQSTLHERYGEDVNVVLATGMGIDARVEQTPTGFVLRDTQGNVVPYESVGSVEHVSHGMGALEGLGLGVLIGGGVGAVSGLASGDDRCDDTENECDVFNFTAGEKAILFGILIGGVGGLVGLAVGAVKGSKDVYSFGASQQYRVTPSGPPGSAVGATITW